MNEYITIINDKDNDLDILKSTLNEMKYEYNRILLYTNINNKLYIIE